jgi:hypothetical protein
MRFAPDKMKLSFVSQICARVLSCPSRVPVDQCTKNPGMIRISGRNAINTTAILKRALISVFYLLDPPIGVQDDVDVASGAEENAAY